MIASDSGITRPYAVALLLREDQAVSTPSRCLVLLYCFFCSALRFGPRELVRMKSPDISSTAIIVLHRKSDTTPTVST